LLSITNRVNENNTVSFSASDSSTLLLKICENKAEIIKVTADDEEIYDALIKTAVAYAFRRNLTFDNPPELKPTRCQSQTSHKVEVNGIEYDVVIDSRS
jgi:hypothetical protein